MIQQNELHIDSWYKCIATKAKVQVTSFDDNKVNFTPESQGNIEIQYFLGIKEFCQSYEFVSHE